MDTKDYNKTIANLYKDAGGGADQHKLYDYIKAGKLRKDVDMPGIGGKYDSLINWFNKKSKDEKFMKEHEKYKVVE